MLERWSEVCRVKTRTRVHVLEQVGCQCDEVACGVQMSPYDSTFGDHAVSGDLNTPLTGEAQVDKGE